MSARLVWLVCSSLANTLQLCPKWTCNNVQKHFAFLSKKGLQKTSLQEYSTFPGTSECKASLLYAVSCSENQNC